MNKKNKKRIEQLYIEDANKKYPSFPKDYIPAPKYNEKGANALTKCVIDFLIFNGWQAERISSTGRYVDNTKVVTDVIGRQRTIGSGKWIKGSSTKGTADISATIKGKSIKIEIKYGKDRQSQEQMRYQLAIEKAGGVYLIVRDFDSFVEWYDKFTSND